MTSQFVAYMDERHGLGAWVAEQIAADVFRNPAQRSASGASAANGAGGASQDLAASRISAGDLGMSLFASGARRSFGNEGAAAASDPRPSRASYQTWTSPRASASETAAAVISGDAEVGVMPLFDDHGGFNTDTLAALMDFPQRVLREYVAESNYVLAVPSALVHEVDQAGFTDSFDASGTKAFQWNADKQRKYRGRVGTVYASKDALQHCRAAIQGLQARGIEVEVLPDRADTYREGLRLANALLDPERQIETSYGPNGQQRVSRSRGSNHTKPLIGVLLSHDKAVSSQYSFDSDYLILEAEMAGADRIKTSFIATAAAPQNLAAGMSTGVSDREAVRVFFQPTKRTKTEPTSRALAGAPGLASAASGTPGDAGPYPYARVLYALPTVGKGVRDHSPVLSKLAESGLSYRTATLDGREGVPAVIAVDVPQGMERRLDPVSKAVRRMPGARRLAAFPSVEAMVAKEVRPQPTTNPRLRAIAQGAAVILGAVGLFVALSLTGVIGG
ncbi:hypothetical protein [Parvularcula maris]|uniref:Uncharacterized protein n=1 Tax=Parvularcula maris TaxID=2965077 RepID=A0A9X2RGP8_9PROT|nr:hypothetical protein [Parvularcula maris]MCQ8184094.1 hypothetical protein [Parvularcula maris]